MTPLLADHNLNERIVHLLRRGWAEVDIVTARALGLGALSDPKLLEVAEELGRVLVTHDIQTMPRHLRERVAAGKHSAGVIMVHAADHRAEVVEDLALVALASEPAEWRDEVWFVPF